MQKPASWGIHKLVLFLIIILILHGCNSAVSLYNRGNQKFHSGDLEGALEDYDLAIEIDPDYAPAYYNRGMAYEDLGDYDMALMDYTTAIEIDPNYVEAYNNRGCLLVKEGDKVPAAVEPQETVKREAPEPRDPLAVGKEAAGEWEAVEAVAAGWDREAAGEWGKNSPPSKEVYHAGWRQDRTKRNGAYERPGRGFLRRKSGSRIHDIRAVVFRPRLEMPRRWRWRQERRMGGWRRKPRHRPFSP